MKVNILNFLSVGFSLAFIACNTKVVDSARTSVLRDQASILVYIDPKGNGDGSRENPLGTLEQARDKVRELRLAGEMRNIDIISNNQSSKTKSLNLKTITFSHIVPKDTDIDYLSIDMLNCKKILFNFF